MPTLTEHAFRKTVLAGEFDPVYYLSGDDDFRKGEAVIRALEAAVPLGVRDFNAEVYRGGELDAGTLESALGTPPMMADRRAVVQAFVSVCPDGGERRPICRLSGAVSLFAATAPAECLGAVLDEPMPDPTLTSAAPSSRASPAHGPRTRRI